MKIKTQLQSVLVLSILGWINSFYTLWHRNKLLLQGLESKSFCNLNSYVNCDAVALSTYSSFLGFPTSAFGMIFYSLLMILCLWLYFCEADQNINKSSDGALLMFIFNLVGIVPTLALAALSFTKIHALCLMCLGTYVINLLLFVLSWRLLKNTQSRQAPEFLRGLAGLGSVTWMILTLTFAIHLAVPTMVDDSLNSGVKINATMIDLYVQRHLLANKQDFDLNDVPTRGDATAPITIVEFSDFQCPYCARSAATMPVVLKTYQGRVRYVYKNFPLSSECNGGMKSVNHPMACLAAKTGWCVYKIKGSESFFTYKESLFAQQDKISVSLIQSVALAQGLNTEELQSCVSSPLTQDQIMRQTAEGAAKGVEGTPAIFVNGRPVQTGPQPLVLRAVLEHYLKPQKEESL